ncbi:sodium ion-translocating decarboxylase subunit beta, partial [Vibrio sinaloensis]
MDSVIALIKDFGFLHLQFGQAVMLLIGLILLYLAIVKKFEPLLLVPIGLGGILANLPDANLAVSGVEAAIYSGKAEVYQALNAILNVADISKESLKHAYEMATPMEKVQLNLLAQEFNYTDGM